MQGEGEGEGEGQGQGLAREVVQGEGMNESQPPGRVEAFKGVLRLTCEVKSHHVKFTP